MNKHLTHYLIATQHPDVSGFEVLDMLITRDHLLSGDCSQQCKKHKWLLPTCGSWSTPENFMPR